jgi:hypothetical protein
LKAYDDVLQGAPLWKIKTCRGVRQGAPLQKIHLPLRHRDFQRHVESLIVRSSRDMWSCR